MAHDLVNYEELGVRLCGDAEYSEKPRAVVVGPVVQNEAQEVDGSIGDRLSDEEVGRLKSDDS